jgi:hypothetical protein
VYAWFDAHLKIYFLMGYISMCSAGPRVSKSNGHHVGNELHIAIVLINTSQYFLTYWDKIKFELKQGYFLLYYSVYY